MARTEISTSNNKNEVVKTERLSYVEWMQKIHSVHYCSTAELDKGIAKIMQYNLSNLK